MIALVTYSDRPEIHADDQLVADALARRGLRVVGVPWDAPDVNWSSFDAVIIRSTWNYHTKPAEFLAWIDRLERDGARAWNPPSFLRWNADKRYLLELAERNIPIVPTLYTPQGQPLDLRATIRSLGPAAAVVKPTFAAGAYETWVAGRGSADEEQARLDALLSRSGVLIQPFINEVVTNGEWSLIFFDKQFSHAILKRPKFGDFRVQSEHGGSAQSLHPPDHLLAQAQRVLAAVDTPLLYARVDGVEINDQFVLMELEALEPLLFLSTSPAAPDRFADAILSRCRRD